jgi:hypothetical protein
MNLDRTVKWIDKTCTNDAIQREETSSAKPFNMPVDFSSIDLRYQATSRWLPNSTPSSVDLH